MSDMLKVESFHDGNRGQNSTTDPSKAQDGRRRPSRASPSPDGPPGTERRRPSRVSPAPEGKRSLSIPNPAGSSRRQSSNAFPLRKTSGTMSGIRRQKVQYENTFRMEPTVKFRADHALGVLREVFERRLRGVKYDVKACQELAKSMATEIKHRVKELKVDRYKYVVVVTVGQRQDSELILASRCLLDTKWDTYATYNFENFHIFATGIVYAFYYE